MEKIYLEENKNKNKKQNNELNFSVVLSFVVAAFAIVSLVAFGFDQVSYAAPTTGNSTTPDTFKIYIDEPSAGGTSNIHGDSETAYNVPIYYRDGDIKNLVFCIEKQHPVEEATYTKEKDTIDDYGLLYILNSDYAKGAVTSAGKIKIENVYITQTAIWKYLHETRTSESGYDTTHKLSDAELNVINNADNIKALNSNSNNAESQTVPVSGLGTKINNLVSEAKKATKARNISVSFANSDLSKLQDGNYQTSVVNVTSTTEDSLTGFDVSISGIDGITVVDENGNEIKTLTNLTKGTKFYVRIPKNQVTEKAKTLTINVVGHFNYLKGTTYTTPNQSGQVMQKVVTVTGSVIDVPSSTSVQVVGAPDTGMSTAQTIFFIGLIVLLCGVGIVYANAKPVQDK